MGELQREVNEGDIWEQRRGPVLFTQVSLESQVRYMIREQKIGGLVQHEAGG